MTNPAMSQQVSFDVSQEVLALGLKGAFLTIVGLTNKETDPQFEALKAATIGEILPTLTKESIANSPVLAGFRELHVKVDRPGKKNVASPENLLLMLLESGKLPHVNLLVDIYNLVSIQTQFALGAHDLTNVSGDIHLRMTTGQESFWPLGHSKPQSISAGEYAYIDDANDVLCRLEVRQVEKTKVTLATTDCFFIVQGNSQTSTTDVEAASNRLIELVTRFCGGEPRYLGRALPPA
jgi:DNA/RNA-binding domain of Phe-tRNA-synthetase-like protein